MRMNRCLYCYKPIEQGKDFHPDCSKRFFDNQEAPRLPYSLNEMADLAREVVERSVAVPGVQPKLSLSVIEKQKDNSDGRLTVVGALGGRYILKPPTANYPQMPENEHLTMRIAESFGINVVPSSLICLQSGELAYITKRIDRTASDDKIHMLDMFQILDAFDKYKGSMEKIGKAILDYSDAPLLDAIYFFELTLFCFLTGNNDMHLKNFSMIQNEIGWGLAPGYDLLNVSILLPEDREELALSLVGKKRKFSRQDFETLGVGLGLTKRQVEGAFSRFKTNIEVAKEWINNSFLSEENRGKYEAILDERFIRLDMDR